MADLPLLPPEIHVLILSHLINCLESSHDDSMKRWLLTLTLRSCNLVCKLWHHVCRRCLMKDIRIGSRGQLDDMVKVLEGTKGSKFSKFLEPTTRLTLEMAPKKLGISFEQPFDEATIRSLSSSLSHLRELRMRGHAAKGNLAPFPTSTPLTVHFKQFLHLHDLSLEKYRFRTFWDLHRLAASLPSLSFLKLDQVYWPTLPRTTNRLPSSHSPPSLLSHLRIRIASGSHVVAEGNPNGRPIDRALSALWFWATTVPGTSTPLPTSEDYRNSNLPINSIPRFTPEDIRVIQQILRMSFRTHPRICYLEFSWEFDTGRDICHFCCRDGSDSESTTVDFEVGKRPLPTPKAPETHHLTPIANVLAFTITERKVCIHNMRSLEWYERLAAIAGGFQHLRGIYSRIRTHPSLHPSHPPTQEQWLQQRKHALQTVRQTLQSLKYRLHPLEVSFFLVFDGNASDGETGTLDIDVMSEELDEGTPRGPENHPEAAPGDEDTTNNDMESSPPQHSDHQSLIAEGWHCPPPRSQFEDAIWSYLNSGETTLESLPLLAMIQPNRYGSSVVQREILRVDPDISWSNFGDVFDLGGMTQDAL